MAGDLNTTAASARSLRWWTTSVLNTLGMQVAPVWSRWARDWGMEVADVKAFNAHEVVATRSHTIQWQAVGTAHGDTTARLWAGVPSHDPCRLMAYVLWGTDLLETRALSAMAMNTADQAWKSLLGELADLLKASIVAADDSVEHLPQVPDRDIKPWSGAVQIEMRFAAPLETLSLWLHLSPTLAQALCQTQRPALRPASTSKAKLFPLKDAIAAQPLRFKVELDPTELSLGDLQSLRVGDVLALSHRLDSPLTVQSQRNALDGSAAEATPACLAYLGAKHGQRAIEILRTDSELA